MYTCPMVWTEPLRQPYIGTVVAKQQAANGPAYRMTQPENVSTSPLIAHRGAFSAKSFIGGRVDFAVPAQRLLALVGR